jgi:hypothetical protein
MVAKVVPSSADLIEEGLRQAARAVSEERRAYIAAVIANSADSRLIMSQPVEKRGSSP